MTGPHEVLKQYWNFDTFRPLQEDIIQYVLQGNDALAILPTGGGKSVCYQVPAILLDGCCLVVSPLIALMKDQAESLRRKGLQAAFVHSGMRQDEVEEIFREMSRQAYKFLFVSPERLQSRLFLEFAGAWKLSMLVVDEAHCISQWGYDFRPPYLQIAELRHVHPDIPVLALSASATPMVQDDIIEKLEFRVHRVFFSTFRRDNLSFNVRKVDNKIIKLIEIVRKVPGVKIIYCSNRRRTREVADTLRAHRFNADFYHAGLPQEVRNRKQDDWLQHRTEIIVCTNAFGMGIDKPDVRCVIHFDLPDTPETYYQEAGRAGRDGKLAYAVILYRNKDVDGLREGIALRYPDLHVIRDVYESLAYYFGIGIGSGTEAVYDFDMADFCKKFQHNPVEVSSVLRILEQQDFIRMSDAMLQASRVQVITSKETVEVFEQNMPELDEILRQLLRMYGGIWNQAVNISEFQVAQKLNVAMDLVIQKLHELQRHHIIDYQPRKENPRVTYLHDRVDTAYLQVDMKLVEVLRQRYRERVEFMCAFLEQSKTCRQIRLISFFGENSKEVCGRCDNCLAGKKSLTREEFESIKSTILQHISLHRQLVIHEYLQLAHAASSENILRVMSSMLDHRMIKLNDTGDLVLQQ